MSKYIIHKADGYVRIPALLEDRTTADNITFCKILSEFEANYTKVTLIVPDNIGAEVYTGQYGDVFLKTTIADPQSRIATYHADGKLYAYIDYKENGDGYDRATGRWIGYGKTIRARFEVEGA